MSVTENLGGGTGRRKTSVARVYLRGGSGKMVVNGRPIESYFASPDHVKRVKAPLEATGTQETYDVLVNVHGGGVSGQAGAILHGISRALLDLDESNRSVLRANKFLTRDARMVERKKYGQRGARKRFQFSKR